jgi:2-phospho-L-lactate guanylyltransferase (CobY/MobA/RfbA family)
MTALADQLAERNREAVAGAKLTITVDALTNDPLVLAPTYSVRLEAPSYSEVLLEAQTDVEVAAALAEFTAWATATW